MSEENKLQSQTDAFFKRLLIVLGIFITVFIVFQFLFYIIQDRSIRVYNPYLNKITVIFDDKKEYEVVPFELHEIKLSKGLHSMQVVSKNEVILETTLEITAEHKKKGAFLNITGEDLVRYVETYGSSTMQYVFDELVSDEDLEKIQFDNSSAIMVFDADEIVVTKNWDFHVNEDFPAEIQTSKNAYELESRTKLFMKSDFLKYLQNK